MPQSISADYRIRVAVAVHVYDSFDYSLSAAQYAQVTVGARVMVPFGRQQLVALVLDKFMADAATPSSYTLKAITEVLDDSPIFSGTLWPLLLWSAQYYQFPLGEVLHAALPTLLRQGKSRDVLEHIWFALEPDKALSELKRAPKQREGYQILQLHLHGAAETILNMSGVDSSVLRSLQSRGLARCELQKPHHNIEDVHLAQMPLTANAEQQHAIHAILKSKQQFKAFLLDGVTGSGKTEVYLQAMYPLLQQGLQILVLVPEIGLTPQTIARFQSRFHTHMVVMHSGLTDAKRLAAWQQAESGQARIVLGTRSAIFMPMPRLGLIILDEEHDLSYKQQEGFRYHARDVALYRGHLEGCPVVLGSATPSVDSYGLVQQGKLQHLALAQRAGQASMPSIRLIDLKTVPQQHGLSQILQQKIAKTLAAGQQVLIFLNRRGYAPVLLCADCGWQADCPRCDAHFTVHKQPYSHLHCHHCATVTKLPSSCPQCQSRNLKTLGLGTVQVEEFLKEQFAAFPILRVDRDSTSRVGSWDKLYAQILTPEPLILLGTQMLAKGHHFPHVTLVGMLDIDAGLLSVDFRAPERTAQLIVQVSGRSGRGEHKGEVYLQSYRPDHPLLQTLVKQDYATAAQQMLQQRQLGLLPPYRYAILLRADAKQQSDNLNFLTTVAQQLQSHATQPLDVWGPIPAPMARKAGKERAHLLLLGSERQPLHHLLREWWPQIFVLARQQQIRISIDVDPQELS